MDKYTTEFDSETNERLAALEAAALGKKRHAPAAKKAHTKRIARELRNRLIAGGSLDHLARRGIDVPAFLARQSDEQIVQAHIQCPRCSALYLPRTIARRLMSESYGAEDWLRRISEESLQHAHECVDGSWRHLGYRAPRGGAA